MKKVLVIGGGGREHAIVDALSRSPQVGKIYCAPGNAGISAQAECVAIKDTDVEGLKWWLVEVIPFSLIGLEGPGRTIRANFYKCGDNCDTTHFLSWSPIGLPAPDFHCPAFFGEVEL